MVQWASTMIDHEDAIKLRKQKVNGSELLDMTDEKLERCGIPVGPANKLAKAIKALKGEKGARRLFDPNSPQILLILSYN